MLWCGSWIPLPDRWAPNPELSAPSSMWILSIEEGHLDQSHVPFPGAAGIQRLGDMRIWRPGPLTLFGMTLKDLPARAAFQRGRDLAVVMGELGFSSSPVLVPSFSHHIDPKSTPQGQLPELHNLLHSQLPKEPVHDSPPFCCNPKFFMKLPMSYFAPSQLLKLK